MKNACILVVKTAWVYVMTPSRCQSIPEAVRLGKESYGFANRLIDEKVNYRNGE